MTTTALAQASSILNKFVALYSYYSKVFSIEYLLALVQPGGRNMVTLVETILYQRLDTILFYTIKKLLL